MDIFNFMKNIKSLFEGAKKYKIALAVALLGVFFLTPKRVSEFGVNIQDEVLIFIQDDCPHCRDLENFLTPEDIEKYNIKYMDLSERNSLNMLVGLAKKHDLSLTAIGTPMIFTEDSYQISFNNNEKGKTELIKLLEENLKKSLDKEQSLKNNDFMTTAMAAVFSILNKYSMLFILSVLSFAVMCRSARKVNIVLSCLLFSIPIVSFLFLTGWLNVNLVALTTRFINQALALYLLYYVIQNFYYIDKEKRNLFNTGDEINKHMSSFIVLASFIFSAINISRTTDILAVNFIPYYAIYSAAVAIFLITTIACLYKLLENNKNDLIFNSIMFLSCFYIVFLLKY